MVQSRNSIHVRLVSKETEQARRRRRSKKKKEGKKFITVAWRSVLCARCLISEMMAGVEMVEDTSRFPLDCRWLCCVHCAAFYECIHTLRDEYDYEYNIKE